MIYRSFECCVVQGIRMRNKNQNIKLYFWFHKWFRVTLYFTVMGGGSYSDSSAPKYLAVGHFRFAELYVVIGHIISKLIFGLSQRDVCHDFSSLWQIFARRYRKLVMKNNETFNMQDVWMLGSDQIEGRKFLPCEKFEVKIRSLVAFRHAHKT